MPLTLGFMLVLADVTIVGYLVVAAIAAGVGYLAMTLSKPGRRKTGFEDVAPTLSTRGSYIPRLVGRRRVGCVVAWIGDRHTRKIESGGGKGSGGGGSTTTTYFESGWHLLAIGPCDALYAIRQNEKVIWPEKGGSPITRINTPSGSKITMKHHEAFEIFWGECDQPVNEFLGDKKQIGISSRWPHCCYILWHRKRLGQAVQWPTLDYELECKPNSLQATLTESTAWLDETLQSRGDSGYNPAFAMWELITGSYPHGLGVHPSMLDGQAFEDVGKIADGEHFPVNFVVEDGTDASTVIAQVLNDIGCFVPQVADLISPFMIRAVTAGSVLPEVVPDINIDPDPEEEKQHGQYSPDRAVFTLKDRGLSFRDYTIVLDSDAQARSNLRPQTTRVNLETVTDRITGYLSAKRRQKELQTKGQVFKFTATRGVRDPRFFPGMAFVVTGVGQLRLMTKMLHSDSSKVEITSMLDVYSLGTNAYQPQLPGGGNPGEGGGTATGAAPDIIFRPLIIPPSGYQAFIVVRVRANNSVNVSPVWLSIDGTAYVQTGSQDQWSSGGTLNRPFFVSEGPTEIAVGPTITSYNDDILDVLDLTGNDSAFLNGEQLCVIDNELFLLRRVSPVTGGYRLEGLLRAQYGTVAVDHDVNTPVLIFQRSQMVPQYSQLLVSGTTLQVKTQPGVDEDLVDLATVTAQPLEVP